MASPAHDFKDLLNLDSSFGLAFGVNLHVSVLPEAPDACVAIIDTAPFPPDATLTRDARWERPGVQIIVRGARGGASYETAWNLAESIGRTFHQAEPWTAESGDSYKGCHLASGPFFVAWDEQRRPLFSMNFNLQRAWSTPA